MGNINPSSFALSQICAAGFSGGKNFGAALEAFGTGMQSVQTTSIGALHHLSIEDAQQIRSGTTRGAMAAQSTQLC